MKTFTRIPNEIGTKFAPNDVYTLTVMYLTAKYDEKHSCQVTDVTREQLADLTGLSLAYIKDEFLPRLKESEFCKIEPFTNGYKEKRNRYYLPDSNSNFKIINSSIIKDTSLKPKEKGFIISLFTICENKTFNCGLEEKVIIDLLKVSKTSFDRYKTKLLETKHLLYLEDDDYFDHCDYWRCLEINCNWAGNTSNDELFLNTHDYWKASEFLACRVSRYEYT